MAFRDDPGGDQFFALRTYRRDGSMASTPVWLAPAGGRWYGYTPVRSWKVVRIKRTPHVEIASSTFDGTPTGPFRPGVAHLLSGRQIRVAKRALLAKYGNRFRVFMIVTLAGRWRKRGGRAVGLEIALAPDR